MNHTTLYRKWRPRRFGQVVGQEPVVRTISRAIETGRVAHAYLFSGPRGTGKTSTAKVLAMGLNCAQGPTPEPDGTCESCRAIMNSSSLDVVEMDAASNRGIDEIRDLRDRVNLAPVAGRMKVYIIDEVHMLTPEAFNALLKMLEEPPEHVVFVLATTEKHRVLPTIISRCQSFDFRRPGVETLKEKLAEIAEAEGIMVEPEALTVIAREGRGSFRDAEGLLDQLSTFAEGQITASMVRELLGSVGPETLLETTSALYERRAADALRIVDRLSNQGRDLGQFVGELISHLRTVMLLPHAPEVALAEVGADERGPLEEQAQTIPTAEVVRLIEALDGALGRIKRGGDPRLELELSFLRVTRDYTEPSVERLLSRLEALEQTAEKGSLAGATPRIIADEVTRVEEATAADPVTSEVESLLDDPREPEAPAPEESGGDAVNAQVTVAALSSRWRQLMEDLKRNRQALTATVFQEGRPVGFEDNVLEIAFSKESDFHAREARKSRHADALGEVIEKHFGVRPRLECRIADGPLEAPSETAERGPALGTEADRDEPARRATGGEASHGAADDSQAASGSGAAPDAAGLEDKIGSEGEVFEMARERGLFGQDGGG
ncbi:MAG: DNA polymerase III subunit gamma/tau [Rubrobacteraceae bacterium]